MATLISQAVSVLGTTLTQNAAAATDKVPPGSTLIVRNGSGVSTTITVTVPGNTEFGVAAPDYTFAVAAGAMAAIGPLPQKLAGPDNLIDIATSPTASVTISPVTVQNP